jgi:hypothetical protein
LTFDAELSPKYHSLTSREALSYCLKHEFAETQRRRFQKTSAEQKELPSALQDICTSSDPNLPNPKPKPAQENISFIDAAGQYHSTLLEG